LTHGTTQVVIIGAGWAGLGAAHELFNSNNTNTNSKDFVILEARDYVGGRSSSCPLGDGSSSSSSSSLVVEQGSNWIQGASATKNPVYQLAKQLQVPMKAEGSHENVVAFYSKEYPRKQQQQQVQTILPKHIDKASDRLFWDGFYKFQAKRQDATDNDESLRTTVELYKKKAKLSKDDRLLLEALLETNIVQEYAASLEELSTWWWNEDSRMSGGDVLLLKGYSHLIQSYAGPFRNKIALNTRVTNIDWSSDKGVTVHYKDVTGVARKLQAKRVIVTVPLGVLKSNAIQFTPALPAAKRTAINRLGFGLLNKVILKWDASIQKTLPFPSKSEWINKIASNAGKWTEFYNYQNMTGETILIAFSAGKEAQRVERLSDHQILNEVLASLKEMFNCAIPTPAHVLITRWGQDEFAKGSYSFYKTNSSPDDRKALKAPLGGRVFFAGEACNLQYPSTTHGALLTGLEVGGQVAKMKNK
jgi:monoamine oxidase